MPPHQSAKDMEMGKQMRIRLQPKKNVKKVKWSEILSECTVCKQRITVQNDIQSSTRHSGNNANGLSVREIV